jgi:murein L,D-transpeptidase YafK
MFENHASRSIRTGALIGLIGLAGTLSMCASESPSMAESDEQRSARSGSERGGAALDSPRIVIDKTARRLELWSGDELVKTFPIALGDEPGLDKVRQGDHRTPEGEFYVCTRNDRSRFHLFLGLSYPSLEDATRGLETRLISRREYDAIVSANRRRVRPPWDTGLGGEVGIHGGGTGSDWTWGCVALENSAIEELWAVFPIGTPVRIER